MKTALILGILVLVAGAYALETTTQTIPAVNATTSEQASVPNVRLLTSQGTPIPVSLRNSAQQALQIPAQALDMFYRISPLQWIQDGTYTLKLDLRDVVGNIGNHTYSFIVDAPGQEITLVSPVYGGTNQTEVDVTIRAALPSVCRWQSSESLSYATMTDRVFFESTMKPFTSGITPANLHTVADFFNQSGALPITHNTKVDLAVTCDDGMNLTARHFSITYAVPPPVFEVRNNPDPITDPTFPYTNFTVNSTQEVWCSVHTNTTIFGARSYGTYQTHLEGVWLDSPIETTPRPVAVQCFNRAGAETTVMHNISFNYTLPLNITVHSQPLIATSTYTLNFSTTNFATCSVRRNNATTTITPTTGARRFTVVNNGLTGGEHTFVITCTQALPPQPEPYTFVMRADLNNPVVHNVIAPAASCDLGKIHVVINASDAPYSSGNVTYNYTLQTKAGESVVPWTLTEDADFFIPNLALEEGTEYIVRANAVDPVGRLSAVISSGTITATAANHSTCDHTHPSTYAEVQQTPAGTRITVACQDDRGCESPYYFQIVSANAQCPLAAGLNNPQRAWNFSSGDPNSRQSERPHLTTQTGKFCWIVYDVSDLSTTGEVLLPGAVTQSILLAQPANGGLNDKEAPVTVSTTYGALCKYTTNGAVASTSAEFNLPAMKLFTAVANDNRTHTIEPFYQAINKDPPENDVTQLGITCYDGHSYTSKVFSIQYLARAPAFTVTQNPRPIIDITRPRTNISVQSDQQVWCTLDDEPFFGNFNGTYRQTWRAVYEHTDTANANVNVDVECYNRAGLPWKEEFNITSNYEDAISITVTSLDFVRDDDYTFAFTTNKNAQCTATKGATTLGSATGTTFSMQASLQEGENALHIRCTTSLPPLEADLDYTVTVDSTAPTIQVVPPSPANTCSLQQLRFTIDADDSAELAQVTYNVSNKQTGAVVVPNTETYTSDIVVAANLAQGTVYTIRATAVDEAGNRATANADITATAATSSACDNTPPTMTIQKQSSTSGTIITVTCQDNSGACADTYYCTESETDACTVDTSSPLNAYTFDGDKPVATQTGTMCCQVSDVAGNKKNGSVAVSGGNSSVPSTSTCSNGVKDGSETDVDCGGPFCASEGNRCPIGRTCNMAYDCVANSCQQGFCGTPSCTDGIRNGQETDVDCGGACGACNQPLAPCFVSTDCTTGKVCDRGVCVTSTGPQDEPTEPIDPEEPYSPEDDSGPLGMILIITGILSILGGSAYMLLYQQPKASAAEVHEPIAVFEPPVDRPAPQQKPKQSLKGKKRKLNEMRRQNLFADFNTAEDLTSREEVTHKEIEHAFNKFDKKTFTTVTKQLLEDNKIQKHDVEIALADLISKGVTDKEAIDDLRKEFNLKE